jgi:hypothetical protein
MSENSNPEYEAPSVEQVDAADYPTVAAAGVITDAAP